MARASTGFNNVATSSTNSNVQPTDWTNKGGWTGGNNAGTVWATNNNINVVQHQTTDLFGTPTSYTRDQVNYSVSHIVAMLKDAVSIYDRGVKPRVDVAKEVDKLRRKINSGTFDPNNSPELKNIFGFMFGDVIADISGSNGGDYDSIIDFIMDSFPEGSGGPIESKYVKSQVNNQINTALKALRNYERRNGFTTSTNKTKFIKVVDQFRLVKPEIVIPDLELLWEAYQN